MEIKLPGLNCGLCGFKTCEQMKAEILQNPDILKRCVYIRRATATAFQQKQEAIPIVKNWTDIYGREYDFILDILPGNEGPRETIHLFNINLIKDLNLKEGDIIFGRPLAAGCPVIHCGKILKIDSLAGLIDWCVVGPLKARENNAKDIGAYGPVGFDGIIREARVELKIGMRYYWMPRSCMIQWRHSGLISSLFKNKDSSYRARIEGVALG